MGLHPNVRRDKYAEAVVLFLILRGVAYKFFDCGRFLFLRFVVFNSCTIFVLVSAQIYIYNAENLLESHF